jgi:DNA polymerase
MSFIPQMQDRIPGTGKQDADILIIGDFPDNYSFKNVRPIAGPPETVLEECLHQAGLTKSSVYIDNFIHDVNYKMANKYFNTRTKRPVADLDNFRDRIDSIVKRIKPKVVVTLGEAAAFHFTGNGAAAKIRGYPFKHADDYIVIPAEHPRSMIWSNYIARYYLSHDLGKAGKLMENPNLCYAPTIVTCVPQSFEEAKAQLDLIVTFDKLSVDIEVANFEVSCIGFATMNSIAYSIPFDMRWTLIEEVELWNKVANILGDPRITKIGQNFIFDIHFLAYKMGIITRGPIIDTMMGHSILYPDFLKGLNFLASIHTMQPYWKNMVKHKDIKKES